MKIDPNTAAGKHLLGEPHEAHGAHAWGAEPTDLRKAHIFRFNFQLGGAVTLPIPFLGALVLIKSHLLDFDGKELRDAATLSSLRHELCHVIQVRRWGTALYLLIHLWARVQTFSVLAKSSSAEAGCYEIERRFKEESF